VVRDQQCVTLDAAKVTAKAVEFRASILESLGR
jgi:hypothetical protein